MTRVRLYGLRIDLPSAMRGAIVIDDAGPPDLVVVFEDAPTATVERVVHRSPAHAGEPSSLTAERLSDGCMRLTYAEGARFTIAGDGRRVWCDWDAPLTEADAYTFLAGPVLGVALRAHGVFALHASAVVIGGGAWAILGQSGAGKSTLAAACVRDGLALMTEDLLALRRSGDEWIASPGHHQVRLWDEGAELGAGPGVALPSLTPVWSKRAFDLDTHQLPFATNDAPLRGVVVLGARSTAGPEVASLEPGALALELVAHAYANQLLEAPVLAAELHTSAAIAGAVPGWILRPGTGAEGLRHTVTRLRGLALPAGRHDG